jgi:hypothetical protein
MNSVIQLRPSRSEKSTVRGCRAKNSDYRQREYLTEAEVDKLMAAAGDSRNPVRDRLLILMAFRHALRVSELVDLRWQQVHLDNATVDIRRAKNGTPGIHGLQGDELRLLRALRREHPHADFVFLPLQDSNYRHNVYTMLIKILHKLEADQRLLPTVPHTRAPTNIDQRPSAKEEAAAAFQQAAAAILRPLPNAQASADEPPITGPVAEKASDPTPMRLLRAEGEGAIYLAIAVQKAQLCLGPRWEGCS